MSDIHYIDDLPNPLSLAVPPHPSLKRFLLHIGGRDTATFSSNLETLHTAEGHHLALTLKQPPVPTEAFPRRLFRLYVTVYREGQNSLFLGEREPSARPYWIPDNLRT
jgi:hypothetical protein